MTRRPPHISTTTVLHSRAPAPSAYSTPARSHHHHPLTHTLMPVPSPPSNLPTLEPLGSFARTQVQAGDFSPTEEMKSWGVGVFAFPPPPSSSQCKSRGSSWRAVSLLSVWQVFKKPYQKNLNTFCSNFLEYVLQIPNRSSQDVVANVAFSRVGDCE